MINKTVYYLRSERTDSLRYKRYTDPGAQCWKHCVIEAKVIDERGYQVKLQPTAKIDTVPKTFVVRKGELLAVKGDIRIKEEHGPPSDCKINEWECDVPGDGSDPQLTHIVVAGIEVTGI